MVLLNFQIKLVTVHLDGKLVSPGMEGLLTLRRAPGNCHFNFVQDLNLSEQLPYSFIVNDTNAHQSSVYDGQAYYSMPQSATNMHMGDSGYGDPSRGLPIVKLSLPHGSGDANEERLSSFTDVYPSITARGVGSNKYGVVRRNSLSVALPHNDVMLGDEEYESPVMPQGFVFQLLILSTWGDPYYVGLNGIELYDQDGDKIRLTENSEYKIVYHPFLE
jgi:hypothetical protein